MPDDRPDMPEAWVRYDHGAHYCEYFGRGRAPLPHAAPVCDLLSDIEIEELQSRAQAAEREMYNLGITFTLYGGGEAVDRILPFDVIPRLLSPADWDIIDRGVVQRVTALNHFLVDVYHDQRVLADGVVPRELVMNNPGYRPQMAGLDVAHGSYIHICGTDIVRDDAGQCLVLEDNGRTPSGVSYVVENRHLMMRAFPDLMEGVKVRSVMNYGYRLATAMAAIAPVSEEPQIVLLSPGVGNSAYFEHIFLAREMGVPLVVGGDLFVDDDDCVYMRTTSGAAPVHVIYRRINDDFLDPLAFRPESLLGVPGLMRAVAKGTVSVANAVGTGVADDKAVYAYVPKLIKYYLDEDPILPNVESYLCREPAQLDHTLAHLERLVVKPVSEAGGYGVVVGPLSSKSEIEACRERVKADPARYISQPMINLSVCPTMIGDDVAPRHVDLRPFAVTGADTWVLPGGLTRVALVEGSLVVNSSQGGGSKDTWVLA